MAANTAALLDELGVSDNHVVGWGDGAIVGLHLASARPELAAFDTTGYMADNA